MKQNELADVLIKVLGLSICLYAIPTFVYGIGMALSNILGGNPSVVKMPFLLMLTSSASGAVQAAVGLAIIAKSRKIADKWFKPDAD